ncbi:MAG: hypothetical protein IKJ22_03780 [Paludibacteraceae bacterium]|nr:hypothetical protein [Paludibacteraceae bacterium]
MSFNVDCPYCGGDSAYCDGSVYECPDCDTTWDCDVIPDDAYADEDYLDDDY